MDNQVLKNIIPIFEKHPEVKLAYFFGSRADGKQGPMSDYDFAVYLHERDSKRAFEIKFQLVRELGEVLKTDRVDVVLLDFTESPELKYAVIKEGTLLFQRDPFRLIVEPKILNEYFDFVEVLRRYGLTRA